MIRASRWLVLALVLSASSSSALAASGWEGKWSGVWGGKSSETTSITVVGERVVSYEYQGIAHAVSKSNVSTSKVIYEDQGNTVVLTRIGGKSAHAALHSPMGDATAELTRE